MAEAIALLGVVSAGVQCAQAGLQLLVLGSSLRSKLKDAPEKVKRWLDQIDQLVALAELIKQTNTELPVSYLELHPSTPPSSARSAAAWVEVALLDCKSQTQILLVVLKDMVHEVDDGKGQKIWKTILTAKRETKITDALHEIERQKSLLNIWLGQNNMRQLNDLNHTVQDFREGVERVDRHMLHVEHTFREEFQDLSTVLHSSYRTTSSSLEVLKNLGTSSVESLGQQMQQYQSEHQSESSAIQLHLHNLTKEMGAMRQEYRKLAKFQAQVSCTPSLLKNALQEHEESHIMLRGKSENSRRREMRRYQSQVTHECSCHTTSWLGLWNLGVNAQLALTRRNMYAEDCPKHKNRETRFAAFRCYLQGTLLKKLVKISFEATWGAGGLSIGPLRVLQTSRRIRKHPLASFFRDLYFDRKSRNNPKRSSYNEKAQESLVKLIHRELWRAFNSGAASPTDVDEQGRTLLHLQTEYLHLTSSIQSRTCFQIIKILISMGVKTDSLDDKFCTPLQLILSTGYSRHLVKNNSSFDSDILEWTGAECCRFMNEAIMVDCMRRWPESIEDWGYPYISDILLRKSKVDLVSFISRGMKPVEETSRRLTPLHLAAVANWPGGVQLLLANGADKYAKDSNFKLPIDYAIEKQCSETVEFLLEGDCTSYFMNDLPSKSEFTIRPNILLGILRDDDSIRNALIRTIIRLRHSLEALRPYQDLTRFSPYDEISATIAESLFQGGFYDLELPDKYGMTPLMCACSKAHLYLARFLLNKGADALTPHKNSALIAGYFLARRSYVDSIAVADLDLYKILLQSAFSVAGNVKSSCLCSPEGFTPVTAMSRSDNRNKRHIFGVFMDCLQWPICAIEKQARAFALGELFDRLQMTHTCVNIGRPIQQIPEEDRLEIENEEEEFNKQLQELMQEYDAGRAEFSGGPLEYLDFFFEGQELHLPSQTKTWRSSVQCDWGDEDLLGPGSRYQLCRVSFTGKDLFYGHTEEVKEENMLALLFDEDHSKI